MHTWYFSWSPPQQHIRWDLRSVYLLALQSEFTSRFLLSFLFLRIIACVFHAHISLHYFLLISCYSSTQFCMSILFFPIFASGIDPCLTYPTQDCLKYPWFTGGMTFETLYINSNQLALRKNVSPKEILPGNNCFFCFFFLFEITNFRF